MHIGDLVLVSFRDYSLEINALEIIKIICTNIDKDIVRGEVLKTTAHFDTIGKEYTYNRAHFVTILNKETAKIVSLLYF